MNSEENVLNEYCKKVIANLCLNKPVIENQRLSDIISLDFVMRRFSSLQQSSLEILAELLQSYIEETGRIAAQNCELANRTEVNGLDVWGALKQMKLRLVDLTDYALEQSQTPITKSSIPELPIVKHLNDTLTTKFTSFSQENETEEQPKENQRPDHVPSFLPPFPDPHTFIATPIYTKFLVDSAQIRKQMSKRKRKEQISLLSISKKLRQGNNLMIEGTDSNIKSQTEITNKPFEQKTKLNSFAYPPRPAPALVNAFVGLPKKAIPQVCHLKSLSALAVNKSTQENRNDNINNDDIDTNKNSQKVKRILEESKEKRS
eukprot:TRINITY_DN1016_c1_g1_i1.p1 TRINITY_DN1016_c1_g1~~TRINITY_DN1016_c1_g1_i1.p1  ORF type:complete len:318 (-),score=147.57 TRINITY_DN1016_c1_g1_i1:132-1085(-)